MRSTFSVLVTVEHEDKRKHAESRIAEAMQCALEEGTSGTTPYVFAQVDVFEGFHINPTTLDAHEEHRLARILPLHSER